LHQQLAVYKRTTARPRLHTTDRLFWVGLAQAWPKSGPAGDGRWSSSHPTPFCAGSGVASASTGPASQASPDADALPSTPRSPP
jgi:hypothetical protein